MWQCLTTTPLLNSLCQDLFYENTSIPDTVFFVANRSRQSHEHHFTILQLQTRYPDIIWSVLMCYSPPVWCFEQGSKGFNLHWNSVSNTQPCMRSVYFSTILCLCLLLTSYQLLGVNGYIRCVIFPGFVCLPSQQGEQSVSRSTHWIKLRHKHT